jgi:hypothetical protein
MSINVHLSGVFLDECRLPAPPSALADALAALPAQLQEAHATLLADATKASPAAFPGLEAKTLLLADEFQREAQQNHDGEPRALLALLEADCRRAAGSHLPARECFDLAVKRLGDLNDKRRAAFLLRSLTRHGMFAVDKYELLYRWTAPNSHPLETLWQEHFTCWEPPGDDGKVPEALIDGRGMVQSADWRVTEKARHAAWPHSTRRTPHRDTSLRPRKTSRSGGDYRSETPCSPKKLAFQQQSQRGHGAPRFGYRWNGNPMPAPRRRRPGNLPRLAPLRPSSRPGVLVAQGAAATRGQNMSKRRRSGW